jgi:hypothetical protein
MKVIIAGSRDIKDWEAVYTAIDNSKFSITEVISGTARGVDQYGELWAKAHNIPIKQFPANWEKYGKSAGARRNAEMATYADALIAVWDGKSKGTFNMIYTMVTENKPLFIYCPT